MMVRKLLCFVTTISLVSGITPDLVAGVFEIFFNNLANCYIAMEGEFDENLKIIFRNKVGEIWKADQTTNTTCFRNENYIIFTNGKNSSKLDYVLPELIPAQSKIIIISKNYNSRLKDLQLIIYKKNWDLILYQEEKQNIIDQLPLGKTSMTRLSLCLLLPKPQCKRNASEFFNFIRNRTRWTPRKMLRILNRPLTVATFQNPPYTIVKSDTYVTGAEIEILKIIFPYNLKFKVLSNMSLSKIPVSQNPWKNLSYELEMKNGGADISASSIWMTKYTHGMSYPMDQHCNTFIVKRPMLYSKVSFLFQTLEFKLWGIDVLFSFCMVVILSTIQSGLLPEYLFPEYGVGRTILDIIRTFAGSSMPRNLSGKYPLLRFVFLLWLLFCLIMVTCYNAGLTTSLKYPMLTKDIKDIKDMIEQKIMWMDETDGVADLMSSSNDTISKSLVQLYDSEPNKTYRNSKLVKYNYGFRVDTLTGGYVRNLEGIDESILEKFQIVHGCYVNVHMVFGLKLDSPLKKYSDDFILRLTQHGFINRWYRKFAVLKRSETMFRLFTPNSGERQLTLDFVKMRGAFFLMLFGLALGTLSFTCETYLKRINLHRG